MDAVLKIRLPGSEPKAVPIRNAIIAGWTGRDRASVDHHIAELKEIGVPPPSTVPLFYRVSALLLTNAATIQTVGGTGSGEVEPALIDDGEALYLGLGSDHTDRELEAQSVVMSKQACPKPVAVDVWPFAEVKDHLDEIELRSFIRDDTSADWVTYQDGTVAKIRPLAELIETCPLSAGNGRLEAGTAMMCGTLGVLSGGVRPARFFRMEMHDPVLDRTIEYRYETEYLPIIA
ncbi:DUF2848 domain-containing protein [Fulvimarina sp. MAC3]|uniref:DUF2848 domain-containing protein n=1 Tax=Fulvimarina sp. MAC3 TaxID=3148887 RepID=UPI0031FD444A